MDVWSLVGGNDNAESSNNELVNKNCAIRLGNDRDLLSLLRGFVKQRVSLAKTIAVGFDNVGAV